MLLLFSVLRLDLESGLGNRICVSFGVRFEVRPGPRIASAIRFRLEFGWVSGLRVRFGGAILSFVLVVWACGAFWGAGCVLVGVCEKGIRNDVRG